MSPAEPHRPHPLGCRKLIKLLTVYWNGAILRGAHPPPRPSHTVSYSPLCPPATMWVGGSLGSLGLAEGGWGVPHHLRTAEGSRTPSGCPGGTGCCLRGGGEGDERRRTASPPSGVTCFVKIINILKKILNKIKSGTRAGERKFYGRDVRSTTIGVRWRGGGEVTIKGMLPGLWVGTDAHWTQSHRVKSQCLFRTLVRREAVV